MEQQSKLDHLDLLDANQLSKILHLDPQTIYRMTRERSLPFIKISRKCLRFERKAISQWLKDKAA